MSEKIKVAIIGPGNIGTDLMYKVLRNDYLTPGLMVGIVESEGIQRAKALGLATSIDGAEALRAHPEIKIAFDATSAAAHIKYNAPLLKELGIIAIDLTPAALGPYCVPCVNLAELQLETNINMVTCGGQATIPIVFAIAEVAGASYAEIVACISSQSAGPGTRANMDEFTETTTIALEKVGKADKAKAIIVLNPADPPLMMTNTIMVKVKDPSVNYATINNAIDQMVTKVKNYVPGYHLRVPPIYEDGVVTTIVQVEGQADFLPAYSGNLDIINAAAIATAEVYAKSLLAKEGDE